MTRLTRRDFLWATGAVAAGLGCGSAGAVEEGFRCPPCGCSMDHIVFDEPGVCPDCDMTLQPAQETELGLEPAQLAPLAGVFQVRGGTGGADRRITVHYYLPPGFTSESRILLVLPGSGRDSDEYRNHWIGAARHSGTLVAALGYPEETYDFAAYHLGGVARELVRENAEVERRGRSTVIRLRDEDIRFRINTDPGAWLFGDFDRIFELLKSASGSARSGYSIFGHSAGAQILHRMVLFHPGSKAEHVVAANAGFYTLPILSEPFPTGLSGTGRSTSDIKQALGARLTLLLGALDNSDDAGGTLLHTPMVDRQGLGRLDRGRTFFATGSRQAARLDSPFSWKLTVVPGVGHDSRGMTAAAAQLLSKADPESLSR